DRRQTQELAKLEIGCDHCGEFWAAPCQPMPYRQPEAGLEEGAGMMPHPKTHG
ncbi:uncharacterized, partial [Tachysurus ichikawai]